MTLLSLSLLTNSSIYLLYLALFLFLICLIRTFFRFYRLKHQTYIKKSTTVCITGGCLGIGNEIVKILLTEFKCTVINIDIREDYFSELKKLEEITQGNIHNFKCDLSNNEEVDETFNKIIKIFPKIDILINNAGVAFNKNFNNLKQTEFIKTIEVNLIAPMIMCKKFIDYKENKMPHPSYLHIVSISSVMSHMTSTKSSDYISSKWGLYSFHESLRYDYYRDPSLGFTVVCPFAVDTGMFEGFKSPIWLFPILKAGYVARSIVESIILKDQVVFIPFYTEFICIVFRLLPVCVRDFVYFFFSKKFNYLKILVEKATHKMKRREDNGKLFKLE